jgi:hypothetical protein
MDGYKVDINLDGWIDIDIEMDGYRYKYEWLDGLMDIDMDMDGLI